MNGMLSQRNLLLKSLEDYRTIFDFPVRDYYVKLGYDFEKESFMDVGMEFMILYNKRQKESYLHNGVNEVLTLLSAKGYKQYILSAREQNELIIETRKLGVARFFHGVFGLEDHYAHGKIDIGLKMLNDLKLSRRKLLYIGDTCHDAEVARELGIDCILIPNGHNSKNRLEAMNFPIDPSLIELKKII
jgi:phosphoglycolate phosphatase